MKTKLSTEWEEFKIEDVCEMYQPKTITSKELDPNGKYLVFGANGIIGRYDKYNHEESEVLIGCRGTCGIINLSDPFSWITGNSMVVSPKKEFKNKIEKLFLYYLLKSKSFKNIISGSSQPQITRERLAKLEIALPTIQIQQEIVSTLEKIDKIKQIRNESDELTNKYLKSLFIEMFGDPLKNPKRWKVEKLKNHIDLLTGYPFKSKEYTDDKKEVRLCGGLIIMPYGIEWNKANYWKRNSTDGLDRFWLDVGDIVIAMDRPWISSGFKIQQIKDDGVPSLLVQRTARVRGKNINQNFLFWLFKHESFEIHAKPTETTVPHISSKDIQEFEIILPPIELQNEFSKIVKYIEFVKKYQEQSKMNIDNLFKNLTQKIFRGGLEC